MFNGQTGAVAVHRQLRPAARHRLLLGRQLRQPGRPVPRRHRLPGRAAPLADHGPRLLHPRGHRRLGLPQRHADQALDVRLQRLRQRRRRRPGQPPALRRRRRRRRPPGDRLRRRHHRRQRPAALLHRQRPRRRPARRRPRPEPRRPGGVQGRRGRQQAQLLVRRRPYRSDPLVAPPAAGDNGRGVSADIWAGSPGAESWSSAVAGLRQHHGARTSAASRRRPTSSPGGTATRCGNCSTAPRSTSTAPAATPGCSPAAAWRPTTAPSPPRRSPATSSATGARR